MINAFADSPSRLFLVAVIWLAGCSPQIPELDATVPERLRNAAYPTLQPLDPALFAGPRPAEEAEEIEDDLTARAARLQQRAAALDRPVVDEATQARMRTGIPTRP